MDLGLLYRSIGSNQVDIVAGNSTDGAIPALRLKRVAPTICTTFPPYEAVPLVRRKTPCSRHPAVGEAMQTACSAQVDEACDAGR